MVAHMETETGPRVLDLCCGGFGAGEGYRRAGYAVTGWDVKQRREMPPGVTFRKGDAMEVLRDTEYLRTFHLIHASFPCQTLTRCTHLRDAQGKSTTKLNLIPEGRALLEASGVPWVMENVEEAGALGEMRADLLLCGSMFPTLRVEDATGTRWLKRHRVFEFGNGAVVPPQPKCCTCQAGCTQPGCGHAAAGVRALGVYGSKSDNVPAGGQTARTLDEGRQLMGIPWMSWAALVEAIPPAYTHYIGAHNVAQSLQIAA